jgi:hypothetical protein
MEADMYDPKIGRWLSQDPVGYAAGDANLYRYVNNGPTNHTDPSGLDSDELIPTGWLGTLGPVGKALVPGISVINGKWAEGKQIGVITGDVINGNYRDAGIKVAVFGLSHAASRFDSPPGLKDIVRIGGAAIDPGSARRGGSSGEGQKVLDQAAMVIGGVALAVPTTPGSLPKPAPGPDSKPPPPIGGSLPAPPGLRSGGWIRFERDGFHTRTGNTPGLDEWPPIGQPKLPNYPPEINPN